MPTSYIEKLPVAFAGPYVSELPKIVDIDPLVPDLGVLGLWEPGHPLAPWTWSGGAADTPVLTNLVGAKAVATIGGSSSVSNLSASFARGPGMKDDTKGRMERTSKGGLHGIVRQSTPQTSEEGAQLNYGIPLGQYLLNNKTHTFYVSQWGRGTRARTGIAATTYLEFGGGSSGGQYSLVNLIDDGGMQAMTNASLTTSQESNLQTLGGPFRRAIAGNQTTTPAAGTTGYYGASVWGWAASYYSYNQAVPATASAMPSWIFYRLYMEDLTVSGRTFAQVDALDHAEYVKQFAVGGRYYGDTFTDPATLA